MSMTLPEIDQCLRQLRLSGVRATLETRILQAQTSNQAFLETLSLLLQDEMDRRRSTLVDQRYKQSGLDEKVTLVEFDWGFNPKLPKQACFELHTLKFIAAGENAQLIGKPGTGKSHVAKSIAYNAALQGYRVKYVEADPFLARCAWLAAAAREKELAPVIATDLLVLDDLFLSKSLPEGAAGILQTIIHQRYKQRRSVIVTSNRIVQDWGTYLGDATTASTILDRLMHHSHQLEFDGKSYRLKEAAEKLARPPKSS